MAVLGILTCEILELEFSHILGKDQDIAQITVVEDVQSVRLLESLKSNGKKNLQQIPEVSGFSPSNQDNLEILVRVLELGLHERKKRLQEGLKEAALEMGPHVDALLLGYGLCGNALEQPAELLSGAGVPIFIPMDEDHPVDDCVGLLIGGRKCYYEEQCKIAGTFFMIPGWVKHWRRIFDKDFGNMSVDMAKRLFAHYERSLLIPTPVMEADEMREDVDEFNALFGFRSDVRKGTMSILEETWDAAKAFLNS